MDAARDLPAVPVAALDRQQIEDFLLSRSTELPDGAPVAGEGFARAACGFLARSFNALDGTPEREALQRALSNPMDLTVVAQILAQGREPDLMELQEQSFQLMESDYRRINQGSAFPIKRFAEAVYAMRLADQKALKGDEHADDEVAAMERHRMLLRREDRDVSGKAELSVASVMGRRSRSLLISWFGAW